MKTLLRLSLFTALALLLLLTAHKEGFAMVKNIHWLGHDTFKITGEKVIYTDPFKVKKTDGADIILITHEHRDHCSPEDIKKLQRPNTVIVTPADCATKSCLKNNRRTQSLLIPSSANVRNAS